MTPDIAVAALAGRWDPWRFLAEHPEITLVRAPVQCPPGYEAWDNCDATVAKVPDGYVITVDPSITDPDEFALVVLHEVGHVVFDEWSADPDEVLDLERRVEAWVAARMTTGG